MKLPRFTLIAGLALGAAACGGPMRVTAPDGAAPSYLDDWFRLRADHLGLTVDQAKSRDAAIPEDRPPEGLGEDTQLAREAAVIWKDLCAPCHGLDGTPVEDPELQPKPRAWNSVGASMGFFFGGDKMRAGIYRKIRDGGPKREDGRLSKMAAFGDALTREQIWALVAHIEAL
ncbi:cytochrome c [Myxococcota bacterium]|nr:cytochrome c [Myxococcota bacterium]